MTGFLVLNCQIFWFHSCCSVGGGLGGALYVWVHRQYVLFMRSNKKMNKFLQKK